jgi:hypothetical protein
MPSVRRTSDQLPVRSMSSRWTMVMAVVDTAPPIAAGP